MFIYAKLVEPEKGGTWQEVLMADSIAVARASIGRRIDKTSSELSLGLTVRELKPPSGFSYKTKDADYWDVSEKEFLKRLLYRPL